MTLAGWTREVADEPLLLGDDTSAEAAENTWGLGLAEGEFVLAIGAVEIG